MSLSESEKKAFVINWARQNGMVLCSRPALHKLVRIINDVALGVSAFVDKEGEVHFKVCPEYDYTEMMGLKGVIQCDTQYRKKTKDKGRRPNDRNKKDKT